MRRLPHSWAVLAACLICSTIPISIASGQSEQIDVFPSEAGKLLGAARAQQPGGWLVLGEGFTPVAVQVLEGGAVCLFEAEAGTYAVLYFPPSTDGIFQPVVRVVELGDDSQPPPPPPPPPPPAGKYQIVMVIDADRLDNYPPSQRAVINSLALRNELEADGHYFYEVVDARAIESGSVPEKMRPFLNAVRGDELPRLVLAPIDGGAITDYPLPLNADDLKALLENPPR